MENHQPSAGKALTRLRHPKDTACISEFPAGMPPYFALSRSIHEDPRDPSGALRKIRQSPGTAGLHLNRFSLAVHLGHGQQQPIVIVVTSRLRAENEGR